MKLLAKPSICQTIYGPVKNMRWIENAFSQKAPSQILGIVVNTPLTYIKKPALQKSIQNSKGGPEKKS